jgi:hypothetical protein
MAGAAGGMDRGSAGWPRKAMWGGAAGLLALPALAMPFVSGMRWSGSDFVFAAVLLFGAAALVELVVRASPSPTYRAGAALALAAAILTVLAIGAVGMIGSEDNPYNHWFLGVPALALAGAAAARFRARGMAFAMILAAAAQLAASLGGMASDMRGGVLSAAFALLWLLAALLFRKTAHASSGDEATR